MLANTWHQPPGLITQSSPTPSTLPTCKIGWSPDTSQTSIGPFGSPGPNINVPVLALASASPQPAPLPMTTNHSQNWSHPSPHITAPPSFYPSKSPVKPSLPPTPSSPSPFWPGSPANVTLTARYQPWTATPFRSPFPSPTPLHPQLSLASSPPSTTTTTTPRPVKLPSYLAAPLPTSPRTPTHH